jgi:argininosuccinate lyase
MPQKKNPDSAELVRGKTGRTIGNLTSLLVSLKGLPMTYNRDLQEDKEPVFDSARTLAGSLKVMTGLVGGLLFRDDVMARAADDGFSTATDLADHLVEKGVPFRQAHEITGNLVALCLELGCGLPDLELAEMKKRCDLIDEGIFEVLDVQSSIRRRDVVGGTAHGQVAKALEEARDWLGTVRGS